MINTRKIQSFFASNLISAKNISVSAKECISLNSSKSWRNRWIQIEPSRENNLTDYYGNNWEINNNKIEDDTMSNGAFSAENIRKL